VARLTQALALTLALLPSAAMAHSEAPLDAETAVSRAEAAIGGQVGSHVLTDSRGRPLALEELRGRPLVVSLVYTSCHSVCPATTQTLRRAVERAEEALGPGSFAVLTVGFDTRNDTPARLASFAREQGVRHPSWSFAGGDEATIAALLADLGFSYRAVAGGFQHLTQTTILDSEGRVYRQVYGEDYPLQVFVEPLKELVFGTVTRSLGVSDLVDRVRFLCTVYDPSAGRYRTDYSIAIGITLGGLSLILTGLIIWRAWRNNERRLRQLAGSPRA
jgi:protein SCO1